MTVPRWRGMLSVRMLRVGVAAAATTAALACTSATQGRGPAAGPTSAAATAPGTAASPSPLPHLAAGASPSPATPDALVALAVADAVQRTGASPTEIAVERVEAHEWPDRSLGCPKPGLGYAQVLTLGYIVVLQARGQRFEYHTDQAQVTLCTP